MLLRSMQNTEELADAKAENDALRDDVAAGRRRLHKAVCPVSAWSHATSGVDMQPPPDEDTAERDYFTLREADHYAKTTGKEPRSILMSSADRVAYIDGQLIWKCVETIHTLPAEYKCLK